jgi:hypothetical protein
MTWSLVTKIASFALNIALLRNSDPNDFGRVNIFYDPIYNSLIFFSREIFRVVLLKYSTLEMALNASFVPLLLGSAFSLIVLLYYFWMAHVDRFALALFVFAAVVELLNEPYYTKTIIKLKYSVKAKAEGIAFFVSCIVVLYFNGTVVAYGLAHVSFSLTTLAIYMYYQGFIIPTALKLPLEIYSLMKQYILQLTLKQFLTEGDKIVLNVSNYKHSVISSF